MRTLLVFAMLTGCPAETADEGVVTVTCTYDYTFGTEHETGEYVRLTMDCTGWAESGEQAMHSTWATCEQAGLDEGADAATCACDEDVGTCTFPNGVND